jgi:diacylglycerol kinase (ATP)
LSSSRLITARPGARASAFAEVEWIAFPASHLKTGLTVKRLFSATLNSLRGLGYGIRHEAALREEVILFVVGIPLGLAVAPSVAWYVAMIGSLLILLAVELLNTAVEKLADYVTRERHAEIRKIKDFGSAAVFCGLCLAGLTWLAAIAVRFGLF